MTLYHPSQASKRVLFNIGVADCSQQRQSCEITVLFIADALGLVFTDPIKLELKCHILFGFS